VGNFYIGMVVGFVVALVLVALTGRIVSRDE
jgi:hypothetical protein